jgi:hypothetical protein
LQEEEPTKASAEPRIVLEWAKSDADDWLRLEEVALDGLFVYGVYVVWRPSFDLRPSEVIAIGQGAIAERIKTQRAELRGHGPALLVTWAPVPFQIAEGVEAYLVDHLQPMYVMPPITQPIAVNLPFVA